MKGVLQPLRQWIQQWRKRPLENGPVTLHRRRIYVLPTRGGLSFALALVVMLLASINYNLGLGYAIVFLLGGMAFVSLLHCFRNLHLLQLEAGRCDPVFAGDTAQFQVRISQTASRRRPSLVLSCAGGHESFSVPVGDSQQVALSVPTQQRGWLALGTLKLSTTYPLGLFRAWCVWRPDMRCLVYPRPEADAPPLPLTSDGHGNTGLQAGDDDFAGLRAHEPAHSPRHVAWKIVARGGPLLTKQFIGQAAETASVDWYATPDTLDPEQRVARLTAWALKADALRLSYALRLPNQHLPAAAGPAQLQQALRLLATHGLADPQPA